MFHNRRWDPDQQTLRRLLRDGDLGDVWHFHASWERWRPTPPRRWRELSPPRDGGGILLDLGTHLVDLAHWHFGAVESTTATIARRLSPVDDEAHLILHHTTGVTSHLTVTSTSAFPAPRLRVLGSRAAYLASSPPEGPNPYPDLADTTTDHCGWLINGTERQAVRRCAEPANFYQQVLGALDSDDPQGNMPVDLRDALTVATIIDHARMSAATTQ